MTGQSNQDQCPGCSEPDTGSQRLREQVLSLELALERRSRESLLLGVLLLAFCPYVLYFAGIFLNESPLAYTFAAYVIHGSLAGCLLAQWSLISVFCMLNWRPAWQRCLLFVGLATLMAMVGFAPVVPTQMLGSVIPDEMELLIDISYLFIEEITWLPAMIPLAILPCFGFKVLRRWTIGPSSRGIEPRSATLLTLFTTIAIWGVGLVPARWLMALLRGAFGGDDAPVFIEGLFFLLYVGVASLAAGVVHVWLLADVLESRQRSWPNWIWRIPLVLVAGGTMLAIVLFVGLRTDHARFARVDFLQVSGHGAGIVLATALVSWCGCRWMRMLGHRLYVHRSP